MRRGPRLRRYGRAAFLVACAVIGLLLGVALAFGTANAQASPDSAVVRGVSTDFYWRRRAGATAQRLTIADTATGKTFINEAIGYTTSKRTVTIAAGPRTVRRVLTSTVAGVTYLDTVLYRCGEGAEARCVQRPRPVVAVAPRIDSVTISMPVYFPAEGRVKATARWFTSDTGMITWSGATANGPISAAQTSHLINWLVQPGDTVTFYACPIATRNGLASASKCAPRVGLRVPPLLATADSLRLEHLGLPAWDTSGSKVSFDVRAWRGDTLATVTILRDGVVIGTRRWDRAYTGQTPRPAAGDSMVLTARLERAGYRTITAPAVVWREAKVVSFASIPTATEFVLDTVACPTAAPSVDSTGLVTVNCAGASTIRLCIAARLADGTASWSTLAAQYPECMTASTRAAAVARFGAAWRVRPPVALPADFLPIGFATLDPI